MKTKVLNFLREEIADYEEAIKEMTEITTERHRNRTQGALDELKYILQTVSMMEEPVKGRDFPNSPFLAAIDVSHLPKPNAEVIYEATRLGGSLVRAVKLYRTQTDCSLREALVKVKEARKEQ